MIERCNRICGGLNKDCFIGNRNQVVCITDMIINKIAGISALIELAESEDSPEQMSQNLSMVQGQLDALATWIKFLQIANDIRTVMSSTHHDINVERRSEHRFPFPGIYHKYIELRTEISDSFKNISIINFSEHGLLFSSSDPIAPGELKECILSTKHTIKKEVHFMVRTRHCRKYKGSYMIGVQIEEVSDVTSFNFFRNIHGFITETFKKINLPL